ncbi:transcriptional regulator GcvA [Aliiroseovarius crassostreae]|uniref:Transcriptional regulator GcvA n=1 Tax=Aliiroseovarius crassostreae TaxID=154981 RepID=A0A9Q9LYU4_9RHOB|nr:transcriptional regulator GcvA [Aliiroseovarius crassostreae]UWP94818.1 transcriptional regulator GcvA [Aliiroseovarius crassostreae]
MSDRLPPLTALRAFDAAARHMSFQKAASELHVTPAALSFQIKSLEEHLGGALFYRLNRAVELTEAGKALAPGAQEGFETLTAAWRAARRSLETNVLTVTAGPAFTSKWLAPRMYAFAQSHPEVELRFAASLQMVDLSRDEVDVAIRFGYGPDGGLFSHPLSEEWITPVMTPEMAQRYPTPDALLQAPLISDHSIDFLQPRCDWAAWFRAAGIEAQPGPALSFNQADHALDAAMAGAGVALGRRFFVSKDLMEGRLVAPYGVAISTRAHFRFLCALGRETRPEIKALLDWMLEEIEKTAHVSDDMTILPVEALT